MPFLTEELWAQTADLGARGPHKGLLISARWPEAARQPDRSGGRRRDRPDHRRGQRGPLGPRRAERATVGQAGPAGDRRERTARRVGSQRLCHRPDPAGRRGRVRGRGAPGADSLRCRGRDARFAGGRVHRPRRRARASDERGRRASPPTSTGRPRSSATPTLSPARRRKWSRRTASVSPRPKLPRPSWNTPCRCSKRWSEARTSPLRVGWRGQCDRIRTWQVALHGVIPA
jgi:hypothetical protein